MSGFRCIDCNAVPPETKTAYTLIGGKAGWRLVRQRLADGTIVAEWRCPECWNRYRRAATHSHPPAPMGRVAQRK
jgi:hypothetical protein